MSDRLSMDTRELLRIAQHEARLLGHQLIRPEHLLLAIVKHGDNLAAEVLDTDYDIVRRRVIAHARAHENLHVDDAKTDDEALSFGDALGWADIFNLGEIGDEIIDQLSDASEQLVLQLRGTAARLLETAAKHLAV